MGFVKQLDQMSDSETDNETDSEPRQPETPERSSSGSSRKNDDDSMSTEKKVVYGLSIVALLAGISFGIYFFVIKGKNQVDENNGTGGQQENSILVPALIIGFLLLGAAGLAFYFYKRRRNNFYGNKKTQSKPKIKKTTKRAVARKERKIVKANKEAEEITEDLEKIDIEGNEISSVDGKNKESVFDRLKKLREDRKKAPNGRRKTNATISGFNYLFSNPGNNSKEVTDVSHEFKMNVGEFQELCLFGLSELKTLDLFETLSFVENEGRMVQIFGRNFEGVNTNRLKSRSKEKQMEAQQDPTKTPNYQLEMYKYRAFLFRVANAQLEEVMNNRNVGVAEFARVLKKLSKIEPKTEKVKEKIQTLADALLSYRDVARIKLKELEIIEKNSYGEGKIFGPKEGKLIVSVPIESDKENSARDKFIKDYETFEFDSADEAENDPRVQQNEKLEKAVDELETAKETYEEQVRLYKNNLKALVDDVDTSFENIEVENKVDEAVDKALKRLSGISDFVKEEVNMQLKTEELENLKEKKRDFLKSLLDQGIVDDNRDLDNENTENENSSQFSEKI
jgi:hypothetical protein